MFVSMDAQSTKIEIVMPELLAFIHSSEYPSGCTYAIVVKCFFFSPLNLSTEVLAFFLLRISEQGSLVADMRLS